MSAEEELENKYGTITHEPTVTYFAKLTLTTFSGSTFSANILANELITYKASEYGRHHELSSFLL